MEFTPSRQDVVRAIHQRWLLKIWHRHLGAHQIPQWQSVEAENLAAGSANLSFLDVTGTNSAARFLIRFHGSVVGQVYGSADCRGRYLDEVLPPNACADALTPYHRAVKDGCPVYTIHDLSDRNGRSVHHERLLLPFARDGRNVDRILASFEFFCPDGAFTIDSLLRSQRDTPGLRLSVTIEPAVVG